MTVCVHCATLTRQLREAREEIAEYRRLGPDHDREAAWADRIASVQLGLRVSGGVARMLLVLLDRAPSVVTRAQLFEAMPHRGEDVIANVVGVQMCNLRRALRRYGHGAPIRTVYAIGASIDKADADRLRVALGLVAP